jgi:hypothetical protein
MSAHPITICPPSPQLSHDHDFNAKHFAVAAHSIADGEYESTGLSFNDYSRMQTETHKLFAGRRKAVPVWAVNDSDLQRVLVEYLESRAYYKARSQSGTLRERIAQAEKRIAARALKTSRSLDALCARYIELQRSGGDARELAKLECAIKGLDTVLIISRSPAPIAAAIIYKYFRLGYKSTQIASDLGLHSPGVRQMLLRIHKAARALGYPEPELVSHYPREPKYIMRSLAQKARWEKRRAAAQSQSGNPSSLVPPSTSEQEKSAQTTV